MTHALKKAVFPVAGLGTRFLPATKASPKEMLPVVDKPLIQYAVEEAYEAGIRHMIFVTGRSKRAIEDHFDTAYELESELQAAGKSALLEVVRSVQPADMVCSYVRQSHALGLGHAVLCAKELVGPHPFAVLLADDLMVAPAGGLGIMQQMVAQYAHWRASVLAVQDVPREHTQRYGIVSGKDVADGVVDVSGIVEKPKPEDAPSTGPPPKNTLIVVGPPWRRSEPAIVIDVGGNWLLGEQADGCKIALKIDMNLGNLADPAVANDVHGLAHRGVRALHAADLKDAAIAFFCCHNGRCLVQREGHGFFDKNILSGAHGIDRNRRMPVVGRGDDNGVDIAVGHDVAVIDIPDGVGVLTFELGQSGFAFGCFHIADSDKVDHRVGLRPTVVAIHDEAATDERHADAVVRTDRIRSSDVGGKNRAGSGGKSGLDEGSA